MNQNIEELNNTFDNSFYQNSPMLKCEYCGKPNMNANCHAHKKWCPYYCGNQNDLPIGDPLISLSIIIIIYTIFKKIKLWKQLKKKKNY